jgi:hypothetical protein
MTDSDLARTAIRRSGSRPAMLHALLDRASHTRERLHGRLDLLRPPQVVAANTYINNRMVDDAKLFVGDAALAIDPLAGQGSFAALDAGICAAEAVGEYFRAGIQPLYDYAREEVPSRRNIPTIINAALSTPTTSETTKCRRLVGFDPASFCAARRERYRWGGCGVRAALSFAEIIPFLSARVPAVFAALVPPRLAWAAAGA